MGDLGKITQPWHYQNKGIETIDVIEAWVDGLGPETAYCIGNAIKYISRWHRKNGDRDLLKVLWYVARVLGKAGHGPAAIETVTEAVRRSNAKPISEDTPRDKPARGINFQDG